MNGPSCLLNFINQQVATYHFHTFPSASLLTNLANTINIVLIQLGTYYVFYRNIMKLHFIYFVLVV